MNQLADIPIPTGTKTYTIQKVTGDNAGEENKAVFSERRFINHLLHEDCINYDVKPIQIKPGVKLKLRDKYKDWKLIEDIPAKPKTMTEWVDIALNKGMIEKRGIYFFYGKENLGKKKAELNISANLLIELQSKING